MAKLPLEQRYKKLHQKKSPEHVKKIKSGLKRYWDNFHREIEELKSSGNLNDFVEIDDDFPRT